MNNPFFLDTHPGLQPPAVQFLLPGSHIFPELLHASDLLIGLGDPVTQLLCRLKETYRSGSLRPALFAKNAVPKVMRSPRIFAVGSMETAHPLSMSTDYDSCEYCPVGALGPLYCSWYSDSERLWLGDDLWESVNRPASQLKTAEEAEAAFARAGENIQAALTMALDAFGPAPRVTLIADFSDIVSCGIFLDVAYMVLNRIHNGGDSGSSIDLIGMIPSEFRSPKESDLCHAALFRLEDWMGPRTELKEQRDRLDAKWNCICGGTPNLDRKPFRSVSLFPTTVQRLVDQL